MENKKDRFHRLAEARVNKIIKMVRLLGNCSQRAIYQYEPEQIEQIFVTIRAELDKAERRFFREKRRFSLSEPYNLQRDILENPHISLSLPDNNKLIAVAFQQDDYPSIDIYWKQEDGIPELSYSICLRSHSIWREAYNHENENLSNHPGAGYTSYKIQRSRYPAAVLWRHRTSRNL